jgi:hypothetical protein
MPCDASTLLLLALVACRPTAPRSQSAQSNPDSDSASLMEGVLAVCDTVETRWHGIRQTQVRRADTTMTVVSESLPRHGCVVVATAPRGVQCQVDFTQDGGDDADPTYVPNPAVGETTFCWQKSS